MSIRLAIAAAVFGIARLAYGACNYTVAPSVNLVDQGPWDAGSPSFAGIENLSSDWAVNCAGVCRPDWEEQGGVALYYAGAATIQAAPGCDDLGDQVGAGTCDFQVEGANVVAIVTGSCGDPFQNSGEPVTMTSGAIVVAPLVGDTSNVFAFPPASDTQDYVNFTDDLHVAVGVPMRMSGTISATPAGSDQVTFRVEGAGMHFTRTYGATYDSEGKPQDQGAAWANDPSPDANAVPTQEGDFQFWVELNGVKSRVLTMHAVGTGGGGSSTGTTTDGSSGTSSGGTGGANQGGCASASGEGIFALVALGLLALRRRRA